MLTFSLRKPVSAETLQALQAEAGHALDTGTTAIAVDIDDVGILDSAVIAALIGVLRSARSSGATVELRASRKSILDTLRITALDKVFSIAEPTVESFVPLPPGSRKVGLDKRRRVIASLAGFAFVATSLLGAAR